MQKNHIKDDILHTSHNNRIHTCKVVEIDLSRSLEVLRNRQILLLSSNRTTDETNCNLHARHIHAKHAYMTK